MVERSGWHVGILVGIRQRVLLLSNRHPAVKACFFDRGAFDIYEDFTHPGGVPGLAPAGCRPRCAAWTITRFRPIGRRRGF